MTSMLTDIYRGLKSIGVGMKLTLTYFLKPPVTMQYPEQRWAIPPGYRGYHEFKLEDCIACDLCVKICPVDCITLEKKREGKKLTVLKYEIDYRKCMFCNLCTEPCPTECIVMGPAYDKSTLDREELVIDFVKTGLRVPGAIGYEHLKAAPMQPWSASAPAAAPASAAPAATPAPAPAPAVAPAAVSGSAPAGAALPVAGAAPAAADVKPTPAAQAPKPAP